jgi:hypothetical protein
MSSIFSCHVVFVHWVGKEIHLFASFNKLFDKGVIVLHHHYVVCCTVNKKSPTVFERDEGMQRFVKFYF